MKQLKTVQDMAEYIQHLNYVVGHHGRNLKGRWQQVLIAVVGYADEPLIVRTLNGQITASAWAIIGGQRYAFVGERLAQNEYDIIVKQHSVKGPEVARFTVDTTPDDINAVFQQFKAA